MAGWTWIFLRNDPLAVYLFRSFIHLRDAKPTITMNTVTDSRNSVENCHSLSSWCKNKKKQYLTAHLFLNLFMNRKHRKIKIHFNMIHEFTVTEDSPFNWANREATAASETTRLSKTWHHGTPQHYLPWSYSCAINI